MGDGWLKLNWNEGKITSLVMKYIVRGSKSPTLVGHRHYVSMNNIRVQSRDQECHDVSRRPFTSNTNHDLGYQPPPPPLHPDPSASIWVKSQTTIMWSEAAEADQNVLFVSQTSLQSNLNLHYRNSVSCLSFTACRYMTEMLTVIKMKTGERDWKIWLLFDMTETLQCNRLRQQTGMDDMVRNGSGTSLVTGNMKHRIGMTHRYETLN